MRVLKRKFLYLMIFIISLFAMIFLFTKNSDNGYAFAESDLKAAEIIVQPKNQSKAYGEKIALSVTLNIDKATYTYEWYRSNTADVTGVKVAEGTSENPSIVVSSRNENGYYHCVINKIQRLNETAYVNIVSEKAYAEITPKAVTVRVTDDKVVYSGFRKTLKATVNESELVNGDVVNVLSEYETSTVNVGTYPVKLRLDNANYTIKGGGAAVLEITPAKLTVSVAEKAVKKGEKYNAEIVYSGFVENEDESVLDFVPAVNDKYLSYTKPGIYEIIPEGKEFSGNYQIVYKAGKLYINNTSLDKNSVVGVDGTVNGSFREGTIMEIKECAASDAGKGFGLLKRVAKVYDVKVTQGKADGNSYTVNIDGDFSSFMLASCKFNGEKTESVEFFSYQDNTLSVTLPSDFSGKIIVYNDYTVIVIVGGIFALVLIVVFIFLCVDRGKYKRAVKLSDAAKKEADKFRYPYRRM